MLFLETLLQLLACGFFIYAALGDIRALRIPNTLVLIIAALFIPMAFVLGFQQTLAHVIGALVLLIIGVIFFFMRVFGGGDTKFLAVTALWIAPTDIPAFLLIMTMTGGALALTALWLKRSAYLQKLAAKTPDGNWFSSLARGETVVPYGVAIALAGVITIF